VLKEAGVVDAGGQGLAVFLSGAYAAFASLPPPEALPLPEVTAALQAVRAAAEFKGFCCEFIVEAEAEQIAGLRDGLKAMGESLLIVGDGLVQHVHIHSKNLSSCSPTLRPSAPSAISRCKTCVSSARSCSSAARPQPSRSSPL
jgi:dihydroxyacetone kinase-like predicted kinase